MGAFCARGGSATIPSSCLPALSSSSSSSGVEAIEGARSTLDVLPIDVSRTSDFVLQRFLCLLFLPQHRHSWPERQRWLVRPDLPSRGPPFLLAERLLLFPDRL